MAYDTQASVDTAHHVVVALSYLNRNSCIIHLRFYLACKEEI
jgi:hypothetical protein